MASSGVGMYFLAVVRLDGFLLAPPRLRFDLGADTYAMWSLLLPRTGSFDYEVTGSPGGVAEFGDIVICPPGGTLKRTMRAPTSFFHARFSTETEPPIGRTRLRDLDRLRGDLDMLHADDSPLIAAHVVADLVLMARRARREEPADEVIQRAMGYILENYASPNLSLGEVAAAMCISPTQLSRRFRTARGITPVAYLRDVRLRRARELLATTDDTLQVIAQRCGYRSAFYFSRVFRADTGQAPSLYRRGCRV